MRLAYLAVAACALGACSEPRGFECGSGGGVRSIEGRSYCVYPGATRPPTCPDAAPMLIEIVGGYACVPETLTMAQVCSSAETRCLDAGLDAAVDLDAGMDAAADSDLDATDGDATRDASVCTACDGSCRFLESDNSNCGACGRECGAPTTCIDSDCRFVGYSCEEPYVVMAPAGGTSIGTTIFTAAMVDRVGSCREGANEVFLHVPLAATELVRISSYHPAVVEIGRARCPFVDAGCDARRCGEPTIVEAVFEPGGGELFYLELDPRVAGELVAIEIDLLPVESPRELDQEIEVGSLPSSPAEWACGVGATHDYWFTTCRRPMLGTLEIGACPSELMAAFQLVRARDPTPAACSDPLSCLDGGVSRTLINASDLHVLRFGSVTSSAGGSYTLTVRRSE